MTDGIAIRLKSEADPHWLLERNKQPLYAIKCVQAMKVDVD